MATLTVAGFQGAIPNVDIRILPDTAAAVAINQRMGSGALDPIREPLPILGVANDKVAAYRIPVGPIYDMSAASSYWMLFTDPNTDVVRTPVVNDAYERYYWASPSTGLKYATKAQILAGGAAAGVDTGVLRPTTAPTLTVIAGTGAIVNGKNTGQIVTRSYFATFVSLYGEEGAAGPATEATGAEDQDWRLLDIPQPVTQAGKTLVNKIRIYRTVTAASGATNFFRVIDLNVGTLIYVDRLSDLMVSGNPQIDSELADPPPAGMQGLALMPNGVMVGYKDNTLFFSENYKPHSWPVAYQLTVPQPIVGLGVYGTSCVVCTQGRPSVVMGNSGASMSVSTSDTSMPCLARQSIVVAPEGVYWASTAGLALWTPGGTSIVTNDLIGRENWANQYKPETFDATLAYGAYTAIYTRPDATQGALAFPGGSVVAYDGIHFPAKPQSRTGLDVWSGKPWILKDGGLYEWLPPSGTPRPYQWRSKEFQTPVPVNMGAGQVFFDTEDGYTTVKLSLWANRRLVYSQDVPSGVIFRLPGGYKADVFQIELIGAARLHKASIAQSVGELKAV